MKQILLYSLLTSVILTLVSCNPKCIQAIKYQTNTINIKAIKGKVGKQSDVDISVGEISIDPKYREANDRLKELDRIQSEICNQLNSMRKGSQKEKKRQEYIDALIEMLNIAKDPESVSSKSETKDSHDVNTTNLTPAKPTKEILLQRKEIAKDSTKLLLKKFEDILSNEKQSGSNNSQQVIEILTELNKKYFEIKTINEQLNITTDNTKWDDMIKKNNEVIENRKGGKK